MLLYPWVQMVLVASELATFGGWTGNAMPSPTTSRGGTATSPPSTGSGLFPGRCTRARSGHLQHGAGHRALRARWSRATARCSRSCRTRPVLNPAPSSACSMSRMSGVSGEHLLRHVAARDLAHTGGDGRRGHPAPDAHPEHRSRGRAEHRARDGSDEPVLRRSTSTASATAATGARSSSAPTGDVLYPGRDATKRACRSRSISIACGVRAKSVSRGSVSRSRASVTDPSTSVSTTGIIGRGVVPRHARAARKNGSRLTSWDRSIP
jgi:hypothetical protein